MTSVICSSFDNGNVVKFLMAIIEQGEVGYLPSSGHAVLHSRLPHRNVNVCGLLICGWLIAIIVFCFSECVSAICEHLHSYKQEQHVAGCTLILIHYWVIIVMNSNELMEVGVVISRLVTFETFMLSNLHGLP